MATRPPRLKRPRTFFHVTSRGTNRWNIFLDDTDRQRFMTLLAIVTNRYGIEVHSYCLMSNHFHLVLYCPDPNLSSAMRDLKSRYAKHYNNRHRGTGGVFEAPFVEVPILDDEHLMTEIRYVHRNPFDLDPNACLATYPWSSHGIYLGLRPQPLFVRTRIGRELFGPNYRLAVETPTDSDKVQNVVGPGVEPSEQSTVPLEPDCSLARIQSEVACAAGADLVDVTGARRNGLVGVAVVLAFEVGGFTAAEIAEPYGYRSTSAVHMAARRTKEKLKTDADLRRYYESARSRFPKAA